MTAGDSTAVTDPWPLGDMLTAARKNARLSLREAANRAGVSVSTWDALEKGYRGVGGGQRVPARNPDAQNVVRAAQVVGIDSREALAAAGLDLTIGVPLSKPTVGVRALAEDVALLDEPERQVIRDMVDVILRAKGILHDTDRTDATTANVPPAEPVRRDASIGTFERVRSDEEDRGTKPRSSS